jgi:hypothetical protein
MTANTNVQIRAISAMRPPVAEAVSLVRMGGALTCEPDAWPRRANPPGLSRR